MEDLGIVDPKVNSEEKFSKFTHHSYFRSAFYNNVVEAVKVQMQEKAENIKRSKVITFIVILTVIGIFSIPVVLHYALKTDPRSGPTDTSKVNWSS